FLLRLALSAYLRTYKLIDHMDRWRPRRTPFPYTPLFRSFRAEHGVAGFTVGLGLRRLGEGRFQFQVRLLEVIAAQGEGRGAAGQDRKSTRLNSSHVKTSYAVFCLKKKKNGRADD